MTKEKFCGKIYRMCESIKRKGLITTVKALIFSDSHGKISNMIEAAEREKDYSMVMFAGDVHGDIEEFMLCYPRICVAEVIGNNDFFVKSVPEDRVFSWGDKKIFLTHGHRYNVKFSTAQLALAARKQGADICIYGHTHCRDLDEVYGVTIINPGTAARSYAVLTIDDGNINVEFKEI